MALFDNLLGGTARRDGGFFDLLDRARTERRPSPYRQPNLMTQTSPPIRPPQQAGISPVREQPIEAPQEITTPIPIQLAGTGPFVQGPNDPRIRAGLAGLLPAPAVPLGLPPAPPENPMGNPPMIDREELQRVIARFLATYFTQGFANQPVPIGNTPVNTGPM